MPSPRVRRLRKAARRKEAAPAPVVQPAKQVAKPAPAKKAAAPAKKVKKASAKKAD